MDPQHRIFLEICWEALERAGHDPRRYAGSIGVFAGSSLNTYLLHNLARDRAFLERFTADYQSGSYVTMMGNDKDFLPTRVSWKLNLRGPSVTVQSACSTSLVAVCPGLPEPAHLWLRHGAGRRCLYHFSAAARLSSGRGRHRLRSTEMVRPFDHRAQGTVFGAGAGVVVLKRLEDAEADGDTTPGRHPRLRHEQRWLRQECLHRARRPGPDRCHRRSARDGRHRRRKPSPTSKPTVQALRSAIRSRWQVSTAPTAAALVHLGTGRVPL